LSYSPFLGGKRICIGKTFAETNARFTIPIIYSYFDFEFVDPQQRINKPDNNIMLPEKPKIFMKLIK